MPQISLCPYCDKPVREEKEDYVNVNEHTDLAAEVAHLECYEEEVWARGLRENIEREAREAHIAKALTADTKPAQ